MKILIFIENVWALVAGSERWAVSSKEKFSHLVESSSASVTCVVIKSMSFF